LREVVENSQAKIAGLGKELQESQAKAAESIKLLESTKADLERALQFEGEVKEKNLLIGKLRHEAVILNEHLTKALRHLKKGRPEDTIDRCVIELWLDRFDLTGPGKLLPITFCSFSA
jgi:hypothetical protein